MIELRIVGEHAEEFLKHLRGTFAAFKLDVDAAVAKIIREHKADVTPAEAAKLQPVTDVCDNPAAVVNAGSAIDGAGKDEPAITIEPNPPVAEKPKRGRKPPVETRIDAEPLPEGGDPIPDLTGKTYDLKDMQARVKEALDAVNARTKANPVLDDAGKPKDPMAVAVSIITKLLAEFDAKKTSELKPEDYGRFYDRAAHYISGEVS